MALAQRLPNGLLSAEQSTPPKDFSCVVPGRLQCSYDARYTVLVAPRPHQSALALNTSPLFFLSQSRNSGCAMMDGTRCTAVVYVAT